MVDDLRLKAFDAACDLEFKNEINDFYKKQCAYVHPSRRQIDEMLARVESGRPLGFDNAADLRRVHRSVYRLYDMVLVLFFHGLGLDLSGDVFVHWFDEEKSWKFHKGKYTKVFSRYFDYKAERQPGWRT